MCTHKFLFSSQILDFLNFPCSSCFQSGQITGDVHLKCPCLKLSFHLLYQHVFCALTLTQIWSLVVQLWFTSVRKLAMHSYAINYLQPVSKINVLGSKGIFFHLRQFTTKLRLFCSLDCSQGTYELLNNCFYYLVSNKIWILVYSSQVPLPS